MNHNVFEFDILVDDSFKILNLIFNELLIHNLGAQGLRFKGCIPHKSFCFTGFGRIVYVHYLQVTKE